MFATPTHVVLREVEGPGYPLAGPVGVKYQIDQFHKAVSRFRQEIPSLASALTGQIEEARQNNPRFKAAFQDFLLLCRTSCFLPGPGPDPAKMGQAGFQLSGHFQQIDGGKWTAWELLELAPNG
jgi:hypothetical protein